ncbi:hypothetical protein MARCHEWKA_03680 [Brevundimonas phage vB_BpoS-Marchewka]|uniref:Uncharacterized protein n=1 Tax=Brevundimonas phage vB_BpoS-Marchewka TaxID=2948604 RepID=A0A9E7STA2_9CAUD|nr:hypothetical protein MARCHEWKA_03680 [Brevundimonas phage vB_BpoS-Marchewka]UTC29326.1 hypothetical protein BAMBUS_02440 [Brevundimonas phage vB_BpoS-Bambus]
MPANDFQHTAIQSIKNRASGSGWVLTNLGHNMDGDNAVVEIETINRTTGKHRTQRFSVDPKGNSTSTYDYEKDLD